MSYELVLSRSFISLNKAHLLLSTDERLLLNVAYLGQAGGFDIPNDYVMGFSGEEEGEGVLVKIWEGEHVFYVVFWVERGERSFYHLACHVIYLIFGFRTCWVASV